MNGPSISDDLYVKALEEQCAEWERMYREVCTERDQLKHQLAIAMGDVSAMTEKVNNTQRQLRHV